MGKSKNKFTKKRLFRLLHIVALLPCCTFAFGQISVAPNPINAGSYSASFQYSNTQNSTNYTNTYGQWSHDVQYKFTLTAEMEITITHCSSQLSDTYLHLFNSSGTRIDYNDDYSGTGACTNTSNSYIKKTLTAGTYYVLSEGYNGNGYITTNISGVAAGGNVSGNTFANPIDAGSFSANFSYSNSQNTASGFTNNYGQSAHDVFYKFTITIPMRVTLNHCGSSISDTYLHLLNSSGTRITYNDDYSGTGSCTNTYHSYLNISLDAGTYYVVSEGYSANGILYTAITGQIESQQFVYAYDNSGNRISRQLSISTRSLMVIPENSKNSGFDSSKDPGSDDSKEPEKNQGYDNAITDDVGSIPNETTDRVRTIVYPNPTEGILNINIPEYSEDKKGEIRLFDMSGKNIIRQKLLSGTTSIDMSTYNKGIYMLLIIIDGETITHKIIKK